MTIRKLLILGAGFSAPIGIPTMPQCNETINELIKKGAFGAHERWNFGQGDVNEKDVAESILKLWRVIDPIDPNLERFGKRLLDDSRTARGRLLLAQFSAVLIRGFQLAMEQDGNKRRGLWNSFYLPFVKQVADTKDTAFVTFNYDLLLDQALMQQGYLPDYCLDWRNVSEVNECHKPKEPIKLLRPNGSMNWFVCDDETCDALTVKWERGVVNGTDKLPGNEGTGPERHHGHLPDKNEETLLRFLIIPPGMKERLPQKQVKTVYEEVERLAKSVESIFFIGWSAPCTDKEWAARMFGMLGSSGPEVFIINRDDDKDGALLKRYEDVLPPKCRIRKYTGNKGDILCYNNSDCEWKEDLLKCHL